MCLLILIMFDDCQIEVGSSTKILGIDLHNIQPQSQVIHCIEMSIMQLSSKKPEACQKLPKC